MPVLAPGPSPSIAGTIETENRPLTWISPEANKTYPPAQSLVAKWDTLLALILPSFRLCVNPSQTGKPSASNILPEGNCGSWVNPPIQDIEGLYFVSLLVPNISSEDAFVLRMQDNLGFTSDSPPFYLGTPSMQVATDPNSGLPPHQLPSPPGLSFNISNPLADSALGPLPLLMPKSGAGLGGAVPSIGRRQNAPPTPPPSPPPHSPSSSIVAFLVPLVVVCLSLVLSTFLCFRRRRRGQLRPLLLTEKPLPVVPRRPRPRTLNSAEDLEMAVQMLSKERMSMSSSSFNKAGYGPTPLFMPFERPREARLTAKDCGGNEIDDGDASTSTSHPLSPKVADIPRLRPLTASSIHQMPALPSSPIPIMNMNGDGSFFGAGLGAGRFVDSPESAAMSPSPLPPPIRAKLSGKVYLRSGRNGSREGSLSEGSLEDMRFAESLPVSLRFESGRGLGLVRDGHGGAGT